MSETYFCRLFNPLVLLFTYSMPKEITCDLYIQWGFTDGHAGLGPALQYTDIIKKNKTCVLWVGNCSCYQVWVRDGVCTLGAESDKELEKKQKLISCWGSACFMCVKPWVSSLASHKLVMALQACALWRWRWGPLLVTYPVRWLGCISSFPKSPIKSVAVINEQTNEVLTALKMATQRREMS